MAFRITDSVDWVGRKDWEIRKFHGEEYSTFKGSSYNSYLIRDEKTALFDTVWTPHAEEYVAELAKVVELDRIDYVIAAHAEVDHSGALPELMRHIPDKPVYCTPNGLKSIKGYYHADWNFKVVKTGDRIRLGSKDLICIQAPMLHWPDSMFCYLTGDNILFSQDAFGHHYATEHMFNDQVDRCELMAECIKYYANILTPFNKLVKIKIDEFVKLGLPVDYICPSHGVVWRDNPLQIVRSYLEWSQDYQENQVTIIYDTMWDSTQMMARSIAEGLRKAAPETDVKLFNSARRDKNQIVTEVFRSRMVLVGSATINQGILSSVAGILEMIRGLRMPNKKAAAFGSFGWSGEAVDIINKWLAECGMELVSNGLKINWKPDKEALGACRDFGGQLAGYL